MKGLRLLAVMVLSCGFGYAATPHNATTTATTTSTPSAAAVKTKAKAATTVTTTPSAKSSKLTTAQQYEQPKAQYLFILQANTGKITRGKSGFILTLKDVDPDLLFFTDRPVRKTGLLETAAFLEAWEVKGSSFQLDPPHVVLIYKELHKDRNTVRDGIDVKLLNPITVDYHGYSFNLMDLDGTVVPGTYHKISIIIDYRINN